MSEDQRDIRVRKLEELRKRGINPYRDRFVRTHSLAEAGALQVGTPDVRIAGRIMAIRAFGKLIFAKLQDQSGSMQIALQQNVLGEETFGFFQHFADIGDFIGAQGDIFKTKRGEITLDTKEFVLLSKTLRPLPEKWHGVQEKEILYRQRYLDLVMSEETRSRFLTRTRIIKVMRDFLDAEGFMEVETPVLQTKPSGAIATPFVTHHRFLDIPLYLRIAPETYLKRCIAGGLDRVYEFARSFRNEGMDPSHLQDFTMLEYYASYWNYRDNMRFTERFIRHVVEKVTGSLTIEFGGNAIDFGGEWPVITIRELIERDCSIDIEDHRDARSLREAIEGRGIEIADIGRMSYSATVDNLYKKVSRPGITGPIFVIHHPIEISPLARKNEENERVTDRFQLVVNGWEILNAYSELIDPIDQRARLEEQARLRRGGDEEAMVMDEDYLVAMEHGMPPVSGWGMGIDRFICLLTDQENLRDVILFPLMKPLD